MSKNLLLVEINEFNHKLMKDASEVYNLPSIKRFLSLPFQKKIATEDHYDSGFLEPWVQWVSIHTGKPSSIHQIKHLGDVSFNKFPTMWETLGEQGFTTGVWGALNAKRGSAKNCKFFLPDPWTFDEIAHPEELNGFLNLPRYMARNYLNPSLSALVKCLGGFVKFMFRPRATIALLTELPYFLWYGLKFKFANFITYSLAEYLSVQRFFDYLKKDDPNFSILFLNLVAHAQHYYWTNEDLEKNLKLKYTFQYLDKILCTIFANCGDERVLVFTNGLSQINTNHEPAWILYRQIDHMNFLQSVGIKPKRVEACMTHDAHIFFESKELVQEALDVLQKAQVSGKKLFYTELYQNDPLKLFYMIEFSDPVSDQDVFEIGEKKYPFNQFFSKIIRRTAKHCEAGIVISNDDVLPKTPFPNHKIYDLVVDHFQNRRAEA